MRIIVQSFETQQRRGELATVRLELMMDYESLAGFCDQIKCGMVLTDFGVTDELAKATKVTIMRAGRKLCLE